MILRALALMVALASSVGCSTSQHGDATHAVRPSFTPLTSDVLALSDAANDGAYLDDDIAAWEAARLDVGLGSAGSPIESSLSVAEIRHREFLRTTNGRPRNDSYTTGRSYQRRVGP